MLAPLSWLKEYVPIKMALPKLVERLNEVGVGVENVHKKEDDTVLELEITPNRPDLLSIVGIAREVAAIQKTPIKLPQATIPKPKKRLPLTIKVDYTLSPRVSALVISGVKVKESPLWLSERLTNADLRPINNIVDITNYVMLELGNPLHAFDYDQIKGYTMTVVEAMGGESFTTVDKLTYRLPKGANIIKDRQRIIDLCGIKGGLNSSITNKTKTVVLWVAVDDGTNIRRTSQALSLHSDASGIYERGVDRGGTFAALARATSLVLKLAGGRVSSDVIDLPAGRQGLKREQFNPWHAQLSLARLSKVLGIAIEEQKVLQILTLLNLSPKKTGVHIRCTIPTYRNDLQLEEDLIEEVARLYGYNKFPKTLPKGEVPIAPIPYETDFEGELRIKQLMAALSFSEANTYSLVSKDDLTLVDIDQEQIIHITNPVSSDYAVLRPNLLVNLLKAIPLNAKYRERISLFELGRVYRKEGKEGKETRMLAAVLYPANYFDAKGAVETLAESLSLPIRFEPSEASQPFHKKKTAHIFSTLPAGRQGREPFGTVGEVGKRTASKLGIDKSASCFEIDVEKLIALWPTVKVFTPIPKYPPVIEDLSIITERETLTGELMQAIQSVSPLVANVEFLDSFESTRTFRITYQDLTKNLTTSEVADIRRHLLHHLKKKFGAELKS